MLLRCAWIFALVVAVSGFGCGATRDSTPLVADAGVGFPDASPDVSDGIPRCGPPPWIVFRNEYFYGWGKRGPVVDMVISTDLCPEVVTKTDATGRFSLAMTRGRPFYIEHGLPGFNRKYDGQFAAQVSGGSSVYFIQPVAKRPYIDPNGVTIEIQRYFERGRPAPCNDVSGIRVSVLEHPEAKTHYWNGDVETDPDGAVGFITIDNLPEEVDVTLVGEKTGCVVNPYWRPEYTKTTRTHRGITGADIRVESPPLAPDVDAGPEVSLDDAGGG